MKIKLDSLFGNENKPVRIDKSNTGIIYSILINKSKLLTKLR